MKKIFMTLMLFGISLINVQAQNSPKWKHRGAYYEEYVTGVNIKWNFTFYDDHIEIEGTLKESSLNKVCKYPYSGTQGGYRVYTLDLSVGTFLCVTNYLVDSNFNVRKFVNGQEIRMWKAEGSPGSNIAQPTSPINDRGPIEKDDPKDPIPQQPERTHRHCNVCAGSGKCNTCNGTGWYKHLGLGQDGPCPSCPNHSGRCSACNGRGDWYE